MPKIAFLTGIPGAGKSYLSRRITSRQLAYFVVGDEVRRRATQILLPSLRHERVWSEGLWDELCRSCHIQPAMDAAVLGFVFPNKISHSHLLVDAFVTSHPGFQNAFTQAMKNGGYELTKEAVFRLDTPLSKVVSQANGRIQNGERKNESPINESEAKRRREILARRMVGQTPVVETSTESLEPRLAEFFSNQQPAT
jgi:hypothetical protein